ncbi:hypothetical protein SAMD00019534_025060 [Acytostelium subglobosum LB1]|uniref:hypothetical protein n=1 Tax=Acytostelium subglobosum LB1 TaxID=1410327 RepID=UPI000645156C|nr:hypothetical protein SAMD00019534_025060 [Acytostelium subglobosum LB1]GAM19331.1 hypothetical protein SAMD00019534_025060 [Acytostelium subglobosum LB1]|eukprot:XP_012757258.1 hypothetical protein SAMD00019534_025060 [Acytostelium subglobosum LB1]
MSSEDNTSSGGGSGSGLGGSNGLQGSKSSILGRRATFSKAKSFRRVNLGEASPSSNQPHTYRFLNGEEYSGPELTQIQSPPSTPRSQRSMSIATSSPSTATQMPEEEDHKTPVYLGADGTLYNKFYIAIRNIASEEQSPKLPSSKDAAKPFNANDQVYHSFPENHSYDNYFDYEQAVMDWRANVQQSLGPLQLPHNMGRTYSRPRVVINQRILLRKNSEASNDDSFSYDPKMQESEHTADGDDSNYGQSPSLEPRHLRHHEDDTVSKDGASRSRSGSDTSTGSFDGSALLDGSSPIDGSPSSGSLTGMINGNRSRSNSSTYFDQRVLRNSMSPKQAMSRLGESGDYKMSRAADEPLTRDPWDSQLILQEPIPELYNTFEEYEYAMKNWAIEVILKTSVLPPHSNQLIQLPSKDKSGAASGAESENMPNKQKNYYDPAMRDALLKSHWKIRSGLVIVKSEQETLNEKHVLCYQELFDYTYNITKFFESVEITVDKVWKRIEGEPKMTLIDVMDRWYRKKQNIHRQSLSVYKGGIWANHLLMPTIPVYWKDSLTRKQAFLPPLPIKALRRSDINSEPDGRRVELAYLSPDMPLDFYKLLPPNMNIQYILSMFDTTFTQSNPFAPIASVTSEETKQYIKNARQYERRLVHSFRFDEYQSWKAGVQKDQDVKQSNKKDIEAILIQQPFQLDSITNLVNAHKIYLDVFQEFFDIDPSKMYGVQLPPMTSSTSRAGVNGGTSSTPSTPNIQSTPVKQSGATSPHNNALLSSPPSRSGSQTSFAFGSPASNKPLASPSQTSTSALSTSAGIESPRYPNAQLANIIQNSLSNNSSPSKTNVLHSTATPTNSGAGSSSGNGSGITNVSTSFVPSASQYTQYTQYLFNYVTPQTFPQVLKLFERVNSVNAHTKLSTIVIACLSQPDGKGVALLDSIISAKDIFSLYRIAQGMSYFDAVPLDLYPYPVNLNQFLIPSIAKGSTQEVMRQVFMYYYLNVILDRVQYYMSNSAATALVACINSHKKETAHHIGTQLQSDKELLGKIFRALSRKSSSISHCFLFILIQLLRIQDAVVISFLKTKDSLLPHLRDLCQSKFLHSQFAARQLFNILQEDGWKDFLYQEYSEKDALISDLTSTGDRGPNSTNLLSELVLAMCINALDSISGATPAHKVRFILNEQFFYQIYNTIIKSKKVDRITENLSRLFANICKQSIRCSFIKKSENIKTSKKNTNDQEIQVSPTVMFELLAFVQPQSPSDRSLVKSYMLESLRHLLKFNDLFEILKKETALYLKLLIPSCREGRNPDFNRNSWRMFFQIIRFHPTHIEYLEKNKYLAHFIEIVSTNASQVVLTNALHYITKLFSLVMYEHRRATLWKVSFHDLKSNERDVKTLRDFFIDRHMFIKIHMVYRNYMENKLAGRPTDGRAYIQLFNLYQAISTLPICQKLLKDSAKNTDYKEGFNKVSKWFKDDTQSLIR